MATNKDEKSIREMITARNAAVHAGDAKRALEVNAARITSYQLRPPLEYRDARARDPKDMEAWLATWDGPLEIEMKDPTIVVDGDLATAWGLSRMRGEKRGAGPVDMWYRTTLVFRRERGEWKVVHEHASLPMMMDGSGKAAAHLKP